eukprot:CAMPEP_0182868064 /NCGR_PEP_ID=MMETSP0034_2-20130328/9092_1 /TAXON_ID=156128 /ORGANISM="Nephroselmis pyriformis, Strain CCMP717" /LENGTH=197 /DNA_ID=CAMNT_0025000451 /DNA_START=149 /DNA_END=740 /DNA_ORIENTATION=-
MAGPPRWQCGRGRQRGPRDHPKLPQCHRGGPALFPRPLDRERSEAARVTSPSALSPPRARVTSTVIATARACCAAGRRPPGTAGAVCSNRPGVSSAAPPPAGATPLARRLAPPLFAKHVHFSHMYGHEVILAKVPAAALTEDVHPPCRAPSALEVIVAPVAAVVLLFPGPLLLGLVFLLPGVPHPARVAGWFLEYIE